MIRQIVFIVANNKIYRSNTKTNQASFIHRANTFQNTGNNLKVQKMAITALYKLLFLSDYVPFLFDFVYTFCIKNI